MDFSSWRVKHDGARQLLPLYPEYNVNASQVIPQHSVTCQLAPKIRLHPFMFFDDKHKNVNTCNRFY